MDHLEEAKTHVAHGCQHWDGATAHALIAIAEELRLARRQEVRNRVKREDRHRPPSEGSS